MANLVQIEKYLKQKKLPYKVIDLGAEIYTVEGVKEAGVNEEEIVKTLIVRTSPTSIFTRIERSSQKGQFVALALCGKDRVDFKKVRRLFGSKSELAKADEVLEVVGVPVGAVCPILLSIPIYIDKRVMDLNTVNLGSGDLEKGLEMKLKNLLTAIGKYQVEEFSRA